MVHHDTQKVVLVTGTSSGFGLFISARLAAKGYFVYATMRDLSKQKPLLDEVAIRGGQVLVRELDVTKPDTIAQVVSEIKNHHGHIDVVVNNAGFGLGGFFEDLTAEEIRRQMEVNFFGVQEVCRQILPLMRERGRGHVVNISSIAGQTATPALGAYNASKWALEAFSESLYYEVRQFGIKVVLVEPGSYPTKIFSDNANYAKNYNNPQSPYFHFSQHLKAFVDKHIRSSKRNPDDVARLVERIIDDPNPRLRYISDLSSTIRVVTSRFIPPSFYEFMFRKVVYGNRQRSL